MKIEVPKEGRFDLSGSGLKKLIQNNSMPLLDLLVRESIQNSLDAARVGESNVQVDFGIGEFETAKLAEQLEGISEVLYEKYLGHRVKYLYVKDSNTKGLKGPLHFSQESDNQPKDLLKLVYDIAKPQDQKGAGGSWGLGKTIYFRLGIGLVLYYSRIEENGKYESRLAACLVEDEKDKASLLSLSNINAKRGLAWWGDSYSYHDGDSWVENSTIPITDESVINNIISIFGVSPFKETETGTTIIIPYINEQKLLNDNIVRAEYGEWEVPWLSSVEAYLKVAVQRWYIGRLNNVEYYRHFKRPYLTVKINGILIGLDDFKGTFSKVQELYNAALTGKCESCNLEEIQINKLFETPMAGRVAYGRFSREELGMFDPDAYECIFNRSKEYFANESNMILTFFRKPGMAVSYETASEWTKGIKASRENTEDVLLAVFVLNSENKFKTFEAYENIEEYFRESEKADHSAWHNIQNGNTTPNLLSKIQTNIRNRINKTYKPEEEGEKQNSSLSRLFGEVLLPPEGFGNKSVSPKKKPLDRTEIHGKQKKYRLTELTGDAFLNNNVYRMPFEFKSLKDNKGFELQLTVGIDGGSNITLDNWINGYKLKAPFNIKDIRLNYFMINGKRLSKNIELDLRHPKIVLENVIIEIIRTTSQGETYGCGLKVSSPTPDAFDLNFSLGIEIEDEMLLLSYSVKDSE